MPRSILNADPTAFRLDQRRGGRRAVVALTLAALFLSACQSPRQYREDADEVALEIVGEKQAEALGKIEPFTIEDPAETLRDRLLIAQNLPRSGPGALGTNELEPTEHWRDEDYLEVDRADRPASVEASENHAAEFILGLNDALRIAARNNREYQSRKETVFRSALALDLERDAFRSQLGAPIEGEIERTSVEGAEVVNARQTKEGSITRQLQQGTLLTGQIALDLTQLLTQGTASSLGLLVDASIEVPLLRGAGRWVVAEPLQQAERNALYAIYNFENFKRNFAVEVASRYLDVLRQLDQVDNARENYRGLVTSSRRAQALAEQGRLPETQVDQALQDELQARNGWISAEQDYASALDNFKILLGLPTDARVSLDRQTLQDLADSTRAALPGIVATDFGEALSDKIPPADAPVELVPPDRERRGPLELDPTRAIELALENRLDLRVAEGGVYDAMRRVAVAADGFRPEFTLFASGSAGERRGLGTAADEDAEVRFNRGSYQALLRLDLPLERTAERNVYRIRLIEMEEAVRDLQALEDQIKFSVRDQLRGMLESRESLRIQAQAVRLAQRRVDSTGLLLRLGRAEIRDVLEAQESLLTAQNALTSALVNYRVAELQLQANLGLLVVDSDGLWREYKPTES